MKSGMKRMAMMAMAAFGLGGLMGNAQTLKNDARTEERVDTRQRVHWGSNGVYIPTHSQKVKAKRFKAQQKRMGRG